MDQTCPFARGPKKKLRRGVGAEEIGRLRVAARGAAVSGRGAGMWAEFVWRRREGFEKFRFQNAEVRVEARDSLEGWERSGQAE